MKTLLSLLLVTPLLCGVNPPLTVIVEEETAADILPPWELVPEMELEALPFCSLMEDLEEYVEDNDIDMTDEDPERRV